MLASPNAVLSSDASSNKLYLQGSGTLSLGSGASQTVTATIPHGYGDSNLLWQVVIKETDGTYNNNLVTPFFSNDSSLKAIATLDANNLYISITTSSATSYPATSWNYTYRILIP